MFEFHHTHGSMQNSIIKIPGYLYTVVTSMGARYVSHTQTYLCNQRKHKNKIKMTKNTKSKCYNYIYRLSTTQIQAEMSIIKI